MTLKTLIKVILYITMAIPVESQVLIYNEGGGVGVTTVIEAALWWEELSLPLLLLVSRPHLAAIEFFI